MVECDGLENRYTRKGIVSSNLTLSAINLHATQSLRRLSAAKAQRAGGSPSADVDMTFSGMPHICL